MSEVKRFFTALGFDPEPYVEMIEDTDGTYVYYEDYETLRAQLADAQKEIEKRNSKTWCAYCGFEIDIDDEASTKISEHIMNCPKHPIRIYERHSEALEAENATLRERLKKVEEVYKMRDPSVSQMWQAIKAACE